MSTTYTGTKLRYYTNNQKQHLLYNSAILAMLVTTTFLYLRSLQVIVNEV